MTTRKELLDKLDSLVNQQATVPTNPYGGQCVALIDNVLQYQGLFNYNFSYLNAIDGLDRAASLGLKVTRFDGTNRPPVCAVWITSCLPYHKYGHIGFVAAHNPDGTITTIEQNIDGNADALENGGWVRKVVRYLDGDGTFSYVNWQAPTQQLIGWFELPFENKKTEEKTTKLEELDMQKEFILKNGKYGFGVYIGGKYIGLTDIGTVNSFKDSLQLPVVSLSDIDFKTFAEKFG
jgi:surface antigen